MLVVDVLPSHLKGDQQTKWVLSKISKIAPRNPSVSTAARLLPPTQNPSTRETGKEQNKALLYF